MSKATTIPHHQPRDSSLAAVVLSSSVRSEVGGELSLLRPQHEIFPPDVKSEVNEAVIEKSTDQIETPLIARLKNIGGTVASVTVELNGSSIVNSSPAVTSIVSDSSGVEHLSSFAIHTQETLDLEISKSEKTTDFSSQAAVGLNKILSLRSVIDNEPDRIRVTSSRKISDPHEICTKNSRKRPIQCEKHEDDSGHSESDPKLKHQRLDVENSIRKNEKERKNNDLIMPPDKKNAPEKIVSLSEGAANESILIKKEDVASPQDHKRSKSTGTGGTKSGNSPKKKGASNGAKSKSGINESKTQGPIAEMKWRAHRAAEDYVNLVANMIYPSTYLNPFGYNYEQGQYPVERPCTLGILMSPLRRPTVIERWSPFEIASFEAAISLYGKVFHLVQQVVKTKTTKEVIEFYYIWKKTSHYKRWKRQFENDIESDGEDMLADEISKKK